MKSKRMECWRSGVMKTNNLISHSFTPLFHYSSNMMRHVLIYFTLALGALIFAWPFIWMIGTSIKLEREVLSNRSAVLPERPIPRSRSPYLDDRMFSQAGGPHREKAIAILEEQLRGHIWPSNIDPEFARKQTARRTYQRLFMSIPYERWSDSSEQLRATLTDAVTSDLIDSVFGELR